jgi:hypothetical protein
MNIILCIYIKHKHLLPGRGRCHPLKPGGSGRVEPTLRPPQGSTGPLTVCWIAGVVSPSRPWPSRIAQRGMLPGHGCRVWISGGFMTVGTAVTICPETSGRCPGHPHWFAVTYRHRGPGACAVRWGGSGPLLPRVDRRPGGLRH